MDWSRCDEIEFMPRTDFDNMTMQTGKKIFCVCFDLYFSMFAAILSHSLSCVIDCLWGLSRLGNVRFE